MFIIIIFTFETTKGADINVDYNIDKAEILDNDIFFMNFLKSKAADKTFRDMFVEAYYEDDFSNSVKETKYFFENLNIEKCPVSRIEVFSMPENKEVERIYIRDYYMEFPDQPLYEGEETIRHRKATEVDIPLREPEKYLRFKVSVLC